MDFRGHNFQKRKLRPLRSFAYGDTKKPELPQPWVKSPQRYPPEVEEDYIEYKGYCEVQAEKNKAYNKAISSMRTVEDMMRGEEAATNLINSARKVRRKRDQLRRDNQNRLFPFARLN
ncbi:hypothetical protein AbraIFM66951_006341 [Aspergillus brasiliensis]|uniref:Uncharacterized protein n=1 Tax=Aspergillus brasiliensis TaxID=319629 RepID=A0A9W6DIN8_9EURO|nr:hypothetical protein AbraCBS73388_004234 [Aspergillus brasiliensis]GKZ40809.1 hypothetical protein AbraIFM66951_006341 [Aspergillus brasiliensis]